MNSPRLLTDAEAAAYLSIPVAEFIRQGIGRVPLGKYVRYDRRALDDHLDRLSGLTSVSANDDSADAAFDRSVQHDPHRAA